jgi:beta-glucosidase/6-phospho-beta-glucosidase/beta-galactosidase
VADEDGPRGEDSAAGGTRQPPRPRTAAKTAGRAATAAKKTAKRTGGAAKAVHRVPKSSQGPIVPEGFRFGVATAGFQIEGGFNGPGEPANNWIRWERAGQVEPSGSAVEFWRRYEEYLDLTVALGCDAFRLSVEWARVEPRPGEIDEGALDHYAAILDGCRQRGLEPLVTLLHFTHPAWLGEDFWLASDSPDRFAAWVDTAVRRLASVCRNWVTLNEINALGLGAYLVGIFPPGRRAAVADMVTAFDHLVAAHVKGYDVIHGIQPDATVTTNNVSLSVYELDRMLVDVLVSRSLGVPHDELTAWLAGRRADWYRTLEPPGPLEQLLRRASAPQFDRSGGLPSAAQAVWASPHERTLDAAGVDYYDPVLAHHIRVPGHRTAGGRSWQPARELWDDYVNPRGLGEYCRANAIGGLDLWVVENGLCNRVRRGRSFPRLDGWDRVRFLRANLGAVVEAIAHGVPVSAYYHWSLMDNYEWGSYQPRFGIHGVDRERGLRVLDTDAMGFDAAGAYRSIIKGLREGDRSVLADGR